MNYILEVVFFLKKRKIIILAKKYQLEMVLHIIF
jgi:hypothetical protein